MKWYENTAAHADVVLSTRVRLARNLKDYPFPARLNEKGKDEVCAVVRDALLTGERAKAYDYVPMRTLSHTRCVSLAEKHLISPEFASDSAGRALILSKEEDVSIMLCEEDHVRVQVIYPGLSLEEAYQKADELDEALSQKVAIAFDPRLGFLTQCPTNLGTGLRASVMLHLPALSRGGAMQHLANTVAKLGLILRGAYGEGSRPVGDIYQLSNQVTLGISEQAAIKNLESIANQIIAQEKSAREALMKDDVFIDRIWRAYGVLKSAHMLSCSEFMDLGSLVRTGAAEGILDVPVQTLTRLLVEMQPATLNCAEGRNCTAAERDVLRAKAVKEALG